MPNDAGVIHAHAHTELQTSATYALRWYAVGGILIAVGLIVRGVVYPVITSDYTYFVKVWYDTLATHSGLTAFAHPFANYAPLYLYLLKILTYIGIPSLYSIKTLSVLFDATNAYLAYRILAFVPTLAERKGLRFLAASVVFILPTIVMNGALWGQSDAVYASGVLGSLWALLAGAPLLAALAFGTALSVKLQAIFFVPVLVGYLLRKKQTAWYLLIPPAVFLVSVLPAAVAGGRFWYWLFVYAKEAGQYPYLSVSAQSIFAYVQPLGLSAQTTSAAFWLGITVAGALALGIIVLVARMRSLTPHKLMALSFASVLLLPYFLPRMHERYFYLADLTSALFAFFVPRRAYVPVLVVAASTLAYFPYLSSQVPYLSGMHIDLRIPASLLLLPIGLALFDLCRYARETHSSTSELWSAVSTSVKKLVL